MMTEMIGSPISRRRKTRSTLMAMKKSDDHAQQKGQRNRHPHPDRERIGDEGPGGDQLPVGDVEHPARLVDQDEAERRQGVNRAHDDAADHQLEEIAHAASLHGVKPDGRLQPSSSGRPGTGRGPPRASRRPTRHRAPHRGRRTSRGRICGGSCRSWSARRRPRRAACREWRTGESEVRLFDRAVELRHLPPRISSATSGLEERSM